MKKLLFAALLVAGTTLGFAKDNVQKNEVKPTTTKEVEQAATTPQADSNDEGESMGTCTDVTIATQMIAQADGSFEEEVISMCESTYPCVSGGTRTYMIRL